MATVAEGVVVPAKGPFARAVLQGRPFTSLTTNRLASYIFIGARTVPFTVFVSTVRVVGNNASVWRAVRPLGVPGREPVEVREVVTATRKALWSIVRWPSADTRRGVANPVRGSVPPMTVAGMAPDSGGPEGCA